MLDLHLLNNTTGATALTNITAIPANDGQTTAGVPIAANATLVSYGAGTTIADTLKEVKFNSPDLLDNANGLDDVMGGTASGGIVYWCNIPYNGGQRSISVAQNTGAASEYVFLLDLYPNAGSVVTTGPSPWIGGQIMNQQGKPSSDIFVYPQVFSGALTAATYGTNALTTTGGPANPILPGKYAILGAKASLITTSQMSFIRFLHSDFGQYAPGFPVTDPNQAITRGNTILDPLFTVAQGRQFTYMSQLLGGPVEPVFTVGQGGITGLRFQMFDVSTPTPQVTVFLRKVG